MQYGSDYDKTKVLLLSIGKEVAGDLGLRSRERWQVLQYKYRLEKAQTDPMVSLIANDNWGEFTLRYVVHYKKRRAIRSELFTRILNEIKKTDGEIKIGSSTIQVIDVPDLKVHINRQNKET